MQILQLAVDFLFSLYISSISAYIPHVHLMSLDASRILI
jgi:hypothetical protein